MCLYVHMEVSVRRSLVYLLLCTDTFERTHKQSCQFDQKAHFVLAHTDVLLMADIVLNDILHVCFTIAFPA